MSFLFGSRSSKTFKPKKNIPEGSHQYELLKHAEATLGSGNLRMAVMLPEGEDLNEWVAVNTVDFFNQINMLYGTITDFCTEESCPVMSAQTPSRSRSRYVLSRGFADTPASETGLQRFLLRPLGCEPEP